MVDPASVKQLLDTLPTEVAQRIRAWLPPRMTLSAARARLERLRGRFRIDSLATGNWRGTDISGEEIRIDMKADAVAFEQSRVELHVDVELGIQVPSIRAREPKVFKLGPVHESVATPQLPRINLSSVAREIAARFVLSSVHADEVTADVAPIDKIEAGEVEVASVEVQELSAPTGGFGLSGIRVGELAAQRAGIDGGTCARSHTARVGLTGVARAPDVILRGATIVGGRASAAEGDDLNLGFEVQLPAMTIKTFPAMPAAIERLVTRLSVHIEPKVVFQIGRLRLEGLSLSTHVGSLRIGELSMPLQVTGAHLDDIAFEGAGVEEVEVRQQDLIAAEGDPIQGAASLPEEDENALAAVGLPAESAASLERSEGDEDG